MTTATDKTTAAFEKLSLGLQSLLTDSSWINFLKVQSRFHNYSFVNTVLIHTQCPDAEQIAGFNTWKKLGRTVKKGEKALYIFAPMRYKVTEPEHEQDPINVIKGFKMVPVFDISQTEGEPLAQSPISLLHGDDQGLFDSLRAFAQDQGWRVYLEDMGTANGYCAPALRKIVIHPDRAPLQRAKTLAHELGHALLHTLEEYTLHRADFELEAESIAFLVLDHFGLDSGDYSFGYIAHWQNQKDALETLKLSGSRIQKTARTIIDGLNAGRVSRALAA